MILNCMFARGFGGLEKLFLDEIEMLSQAGMPARGLVRRGSALERYARERGLSCDAISAWSDWDPFSRARAHAVIARVQPQLIMCVGSRGAPAHGARSPTGYPDRVHGAENGDSTEISGTTACWSRPNIAAVR